MINIHFINLTNVTPEKYKEEYFVLRQQFEEEKFGYLPPALEYYRILQNLPEEDGKAFYPTLLVNDDDSVIGFGIQGWNTKYDNLQSGWLDLFITPQMRRKGLGLIILKKIISIFPEQVKILHAYAMRSTRGFFFLKQFKNKPDSEEYMLTADITEFDVAEIRKEIRILADKTKKNGYEIVKIENLNFDNSLSIEDFVALTEEIANDIPRGEFSVERMVHTTERYRNRIERHLLAGYTVVSFVAVDISSGKPLGFTTVVTNKYYPHQAKQRHTGVLSSHRGRSLGLMLKYQTLLFLLEKTKVRYWTTENNTTNIHMFKINKLLKHKITNIQSGFEINKEEIVKLLT